MERRTTDSQESPPASFRFKLVILALLCCQNAGHALLARYSQSIRKERYSSTEVVLVSELIKIVVSTVLVIYERSEADPTVNPYYKILSLLVSAEKIIVLVILYSISNLLSYYALARVDAAVYTVLLQLKILTTAAFSVVFLGRSFSGAKWRALLLLVIGCVLVASPAFNERCQIEQEGNGKSLDLVASLLGVGAIVVMVIISGYAAVYLEKMLKRENVSVWERNLQLAVYSTILLVSVSFSEQSYTSGNFNSFFQGWTVSAVLLALIQASGGILVAATVKYADSILKTLATSGSIVFSAILGFLLLDGPLDIFVSIGCVATILAIFNYTLDSTV